MKLYIYILLGILISACSNQSKETQTSNNITNESTITLTDAQLKNADLQIGSMIQTQMTSVLKVHGKIDVPPQNMVFISVPMGGYLKSTHLLPGMHVNKGEAIATVEDQQYIQLQQDYLTAKAKLLYAEKEYIRQRDLNKSKASSDKVYQQAESEYASYKIQCGSLYEKLQLIGINPNTLNDANISRSINIVSPITGFVSKVNVNTGKYLSSSDVLFELVNPSDIHLNLTIFEKDINKLKIGQKLVAYTNNDASKKYVCEILLIGKDISPDRNVEVHCHFEEYDKDLIPGMFMNAEIELKNNSAFTLPEDAVVRFENKHYIFKVNNKNTFEMMEVEIGATMNGQSEIILPDSKTTGNYITKGAYNILMAMKNKEEEE